MTAAIAIVALILLGAAFISAALRAPLREQDADDAFPDVEHADSGGHVSPCFCRSDDPGVLHRLDGPCVVVNERDAS